MAAGFLRNVQQLQVKMADALRTASILPQDEAQKLRDALGKLVVEALHDKGHALSLALQNFNKFWMEHPELSAELFKSEGFRSFVGDQTAVAEPTASQKKPMRKKPETPEYSKKQLLLLLDPQPGTSGPLRQFWPLQTLLLVAAESASRAALAEILVIPEDWIAQALEALRPIHLQFDAAQQLRMLHDACDLLARPINPEPTLDGKLLSVGGKKPVRLSAREAKLMAYLLAVPGKSYSINDLQAQGIASPRDTISRLRKKLEKKKVELHLETTTGGYCYLPSDPN